MHTRKFILAAAAILLLSPSLGAQNKPKRNDLPKAEIFLPAPPAFGDPFFVRDSLYYIWGLETRQTERGALAVADADLSIEYFMKRFGEAMGRPEMNPKDYPAVAAYMEYVIPNCRASISKAKKQFARQRPYSHFHTQSATPDHESEKDWYRSYPSGHSVRAWGLSLALAAIDVEHQDAILVVGQELCLSRVIVGFHYKSDTEAAMLAASATYARISMDKKFRVLQKKALRELGKK